MSTKKAKGAKAQIEAIESNGVHFEVAPEFQAPVAETTDATATSKKKAKKPKVELTIALLAEGYLHALEDSGSGAGTIASYGMELKLAMKELGSETPVALLTEDRVAEYFASPAVMTTRTGKPKAPPTFLKTQRVLRQALVWAQTEGLIEKAPLPEPKQ